MEITTYLKKRKCLRCKKDIADQEHAARKFCRNKTLPDASVQSCKDDYHSPLRKKKNEPYKNIADFQKNMHDRIEFLAASAGEKVTTDQLKAAGIILSRPVEFFRNTSGLLTCYYIKYAITQIENNNFKIITHERSF